MTPGAGPLRHGRFRSLALLTTAWLVVASAVLVSDLPVGVRAQFSAIVLPASALVTATSCAVTAVRSSGRRRRAWALFAAAGYLAGLANLAALLIGPTQAGDFAYVTALVLGILALLSLPATPLRGTRVAQMVLDGVVVGGSVLFVAAVAVFPGLEVSNGLTLPILTALVLPLIDAVVVTLAVFVITRSARRERVPLILAALCFTFFALGDLSYAVFGMSAFEFGTPVDLTWIIGYGLGALAARHPDAVGTDVALTPEESPVAATALTFGLFIFAAVIGVATMNRLPWGAVALVLWAIILLAVAARQTILVVDNERLRRALERRVRARTDELRAMTRSTELMLSSVGDGIYGVDRDGNVTFVNPAAAETLGYTETELVGRHAHATFHAARPDGVPFPYEGCYIAEAIGNGATVTAEEDIYRRADGETVPVEVTASPVLDGPVVRGAVVVFRDVTERQEIDRMKDEFVSVISHELRTPLASIRGSLGLLAGGAAGRLTPQAERMATIAMESSKRLARLIDDMLEVERMQAGAAVINTDDHAAAALVEAALDEVRSAANEAQVDLRRGDITGQVYADADRIVQTLINLLGNAIKFSPRGAAVLVEAGPSGGYVEFRVIDHGRGIPEDRLERIFGRFEQVDASDAREKGGTGLGLAISREIVERHGGRIWATSRLGEGSTFHVTLPRAETWTGTGNR